jgi:SAM-dependent methyltransferase
VTGPAQWSNHLWLTARLYEPLWRRHSVALMTGRAFDTRRELASMRKHLDLAEGSAVVDLGCSAGLYARTLAAAGMIVSAVDVSRAFLAEGERLARREGRQVRFVHADVLALPFDDAAFDGAVSGGSLNEFVDAARALSEAARVLRDGAPVWLMYAARSETIVGRALQGALRASGLRFPAPAQVDAWALAAGLTPERSERRGPLVFALYRRGGGLPPLATTSPSPGWDRPTPRRNRRFNWERDSGARR